MGGHELQKILVTSFVPPKTRDFSDLQHVARVPDSQECLKKYDPFSSDSFSFGIGVVLSWNDA